jgi:hypothetical protein
MLIKINETGSIFNNAIEFIKNKHNIKTASKAAAQVIIDYEGLLEQQSKLMDMLAIEREKVYELEEKVNKTKKCLTFLNSL